MIVSPTRLCFSTLLSGMQTKACGAQTQRETWRLIPVYPFAVEPILTHLHLDLNQFASGLRISRINHQI